MRSNEIRLVAALVATIIGSIVVGSTNRVGATSRSETAMPSSVEVKLTNGQTEILYPFKVEEGNGHHSGAQCGVVISGQRIEIIGVGDMEVYTCDGFVEAGPLPPIDNAERIGLIYDVSSPNVAFRTAVILVHDSKGWSLDAESLGRFDGLPEAKSVRTLAKTLAKHKQ